VAGRAPPRQDNEYVYKDVSCVAPTSKYDELIAGPMELATELAEGPRVAMRLLRGATCKAAPLIFDQAGDGIASKTALSEFHQDAKDGAPAFFQGRPAALNSSLDDGEDTEIEAP
jgi:hypothetical protein